MKLQTYLLLAVAVLAAALLLFIAENIALSRDRDRVSHNYETATSELSHYKKGDQWFAKGGTLDLKISELSDSLKDVLRKEFDLKLSSVKTIITNELRVTSELKTQIRDTTIFDTIPARYFKSHNEFTEVEYIEDAATGKGKLSMSTRVPLIQVVHKRRIGFKPWLKAWWKAKPLDQVITSKNPDVKIDYSSIINIQE